MPSVGLLGTENLNGSTTLPFRPNGYELAKIQPEEVEEIEKKPQVMGSSTGLGVGERNGRHGPEITAPAVRKGDEYDVDFE
jgi:hypothetical protein